MRIKIILATIVFLCILLVGTICVSADTYGDLVYEIVDHEITIKWCVSSAEGRVFVPDNIDNIPVRTIGENAFSFAYNVTEVYIDDGITRIEYGAFASACATSVRLPSTLLSMGDRVFYGSDIETITIPARCSEIGNYPFNDCDNLKRITVEENNENYSSLNGVLFNKDKTVLMHYPSGKTDTSYAVPGGVEEIGVRAFYECLNLKEISIPNTLKSCHDSFFGNNIEKVYITDLTAWCNIDFPSDDSNPLFYGVDLYLNGDLVEDLRIPEGVTAVKDYAFVGGTFKSISIPGTVNSIGRESFSACENLTTAVLSEGVKKIDYGAFLCCKKLKSISIPDSVLELGNVVFMDCIDLEFVDIGKGLYRTNGRLFENCWKLKSITVDSENNTFSSVDGVLFDKSKSILWRYPASKSDSFYYIPSGVEIIVGSAFKDAKNLETITLPGTIRSIENYAFDGCNNISDKFFLGTEEEWNNVSVGINGNGILTRVICAPGPCTKTTANKETNKIKVNVLNVEAPKKIILVLYKENRIKSIITSEYIGAQMEFSTTEEYDVVRVMAWDTVKRLDPATIDEEVKLDNTI